MQGRVAAVTVRFEVRRPPWRRGRPHVAGPRQAQNRASVKVWVVCLQPLPKRVACAHLVHVRPPVAQDDDLDDLTKLREDCEARGGRAQPLAGRERGADAIRAASGLQRAPRRTLPDAILFERLRDLANEELHNITALLLCEIGAHGRSGQRIH